MRSDEYIEENRQDSKRHSKEDCDEPWRYRVELDVFGHPSSRNHSWPRNWGDPHQKNDVSVHSNFRSPLAEGVGVDQDYLYNLFRYSHSGSLCYECE